MHPISLWCFEIFLAFLPLIVRGTSDPWSSQDFFLVAFIVTITTMLAILNKIDLRRLGGSLSLVSLLIASILLIIAYSSAPSDLLISVVVNVTALVACSVIRYYIIWEHEIQQLNKQATPSTIPSINSGLTKSSASSATPHAYVENDDIAEKSVPLESDQSQLKDKIK